MTREVRSAFAGDTDALERLRAALGAGELTGMDAAHAHLGLAHLLVRDGLHDQAQPHVAAATAAAVEARIPVPQGRIVFRVAVALLLMRLAAQPAEVAAPPTDVPAARLLALARLDVASVSDLPVLGSWALGGPRGGPPRSAARADPVGIGCAAGRQRRIPCSARTRDRARHPAGVGRITARRVGGRGGGPGA